MTRREFMGWMVAAVVAMVAGSRIWRLFRQAAERGEAYGVITEIDQALGTITVAWDQPGIYDAGPLSWGKIRQTRHAIEWGLVRA